MASLPNGTGYSIAAVSKLTGVSCHALRVWERRYGFPVPGRSPSGHRRYPKEQVGVLRELTKLARLGKSIGDLIGDYQLGKLEIRDSDEKPIEEKPLFSPVVDWFFKGDTASADALIDELAARTSTLELIERLIEPALVDIGERWFRGEAHIFQERYATYCLMARLSRMLDQARRANFKPVRSVLVGAVAGDHHQGGVLMVCLSLETAGWRALPLGPTSLSWNYRKRSMNGGPMPWHSRSCSPGTSTSDSWNCRRSGAFPSSWGAGASSTTKVWPVVTA